MTSIFCSVHLEISLVFILNSDRTVDARYFPVTLRWTVGAQIVRFLRVCWVCIHLHGHVPINQYFNWICAREMSHKTQFPQPTESDINIGDCAHRMVGKQSRPIVVYIHIDELY